jgi:hypothetical protein
MFATATPTRVATNNEPCPRVIGYLASQPSRSNRLAWLRAATSLQPIAHRHASNGAGPTLANHRTPAIVPGPGLSTLVILTHLTAPHVRDRPASAPVALHHCKSA